MGVDKERLTHIHARAKLMRNELEAMAAECCMILGVDPDRDSYERDLCNEIVLHGFEPETVIQKLKELRSESASNL